MPQIKMNLGKLGFWDYTVVAVTLLASVLIGMYFRFTGGKQKTNEEYMLGNRNMSIFPVGVSLMASFTSAVGLLGNSAEVYKNGLIYSLISIGYILATPIINYFYLPVFYSLSDLSTYEYLERRFGRKTRMLTSLAFTLQMLLFNGIVLYAPAIVLEAATGFNRYFSIIAVGVVCTFYSTLGGMKAVVWSDSLQSLLMIIALLLVLCFSMHDAGGWAKSFKIAKKGGRLDFNSFSLDPTVRHTWWSLIVGGMFISLSLNVNHTQVIRFKTLPSIKAAQRAMWLGNPLLAIMVTITCLSGISLYAVYHKNDPLAAGLIGAADQIMPYYVVAALTKYPGLAGLFVAGILNASLSTLSTACNSLAGVTVVDYLGNYIEPSAHWTKIAACVYGFLFLIIAFVAENFGGVMEAGLTIFGAVGGPVLGVFSLGLFTTYASEYGTLFGLLTGIPFTLWISFGTPRPKADHPTPYSRAAEPHYFYLYRLSYLWLALIGFIWVMVIGSIVSVIWKKKHPWDGDDPDYELFTPLLARYIKRKHKANAVIANVVLTHRRKRT